jgi:hypothetical protein
LLKQKVAPKVAIILGYFILSNNHNEPPKVAQLEKIAQSGHPVATAGFLAIFNEPTTFNGRQIKIIQGHLTKRDEAQQGWYSQSYARPPYDRNWGRYYKTS